MCLDSGREAEKLDYITKYLKAVAMFRDYNDVSQDPEFTQVQHIIDSNIKISISPAQNSNKYTVVVQLYVYSGKI